MDTWYAINGKVLSLNECRVNKQSDDPESTRDLRTISARVSEVRKRVSEYRFEREQVLRMMEFAQGSSTLSSGRGGSQGFLNLFPSPNWVKTQTGSDCSWPLMQPKLV